jgi:hypothetical protein
MCVSVFIRYPVLISCNMRYLLRNFIRSDFEFILSMWRPIKTRTNFNKQNWNITVHRKIFVGKYERTGKTSAFFVQLTDWVERTNSWEIPILKHSLLPLIMPKIIELKEGVFFVSLYEVLSKYLSFCQVFSELGGEIQLGVYIKCPRMFRDFGWNLKMLTNSSKTLQYNCKTWRCHNCFAGKKN